MAYEVEVEWFKHILNEYSKHGYQVHEPKHVDDIVFIQHDDFGDIRIEFSPERTGIKVVLTLDSSSYTAIDAIDYFNHYFSRVKVYPMVGENAMHYSMFIPFGVDADDWCDAALRNFMEDVAILDSYFKDEQEARSAINRMIEAEKEFEEKYAGLSPNNYRAGN